MSQFIVAIWVNGAFSIHSEHDNADAAAQEYHSYVSAVIAEARQAEEYHATIKVLDFQLDNYNELHYTINKTKPAEPEPEPETPEIIEEPAAE